MVCIEKKGLSVDSFGKALIVLYKTEPIPFSESVDRLSFEKRKTELSNKFSERSVLRFSLALYLEKFAFEPPMIPSCA